MTESATDDQPTATVTADRPTARAWVILAVLVTATLFGFVDRQVLVVLAEAIKHDLSLNDGQLGMIQGLGPGLLAAVGVAMLGWLSDRMPRQILLAVSVLLWTLATAACGLTHSFLDMMLTSIAIGLGEAALGPIVYSAIPDLFPGRARYTANMVYVGASLVGSGFGIALAGATVGWIQAHGASLPWGLAHAPTWRVAFFLAAIPGLPLAAIILCLGSIARTAPPSSDPARSSLVGYLKQHWQGLGGLLAAMCSYSIGLTAAVTWTPVYIIRVLKGSAAEVGMAFGITLAGASVLSVLIAGAAVRRLSSTIGQMAPARIFQIGFCVAVVPTIAQLFATRPWHAYVLIGAEMVATMMSATMFTTLIQDLSPAQLRGRILSITTLLYLVAGGLGSIIVGLVSDHVPQGSHGLLIALVAITVPGFLAAAAILWLVDKPFRRTVAEFAPPLV